MWPELNTLGIIGPNEYPYISDYDRKYNIEEPHNIVTAQDRAESLPSGVLYNIPFSDLNSPALIPSYEKQIYPEAPLELRPKNKINKSRNLLKRSKYKGKTRAHKYNVNRKSTLLTRL